ncbi:MAG: glycosyltransferase family 2 protein [Ginsengibacter sp.]
METVIAVVVTFNRQKLLAECLEALKSQTRSIDKILVINNGSTDSTKSWLAGQQGIDYFTQENIGSGGGFNTGIRMAFEKNYDWIWLMDDDGFPREDALENLLEDSSNKMCLRNCAVINKDDKNSFVWKTGNYTGLDTVNEEIIHNYAHPFNGTLLHRDIIKKVGLPKKELFIWGDETEYYHRIITKFKIPFYTKTNSIHYHPASAYSYKKDWDFYTNWKIFYYVRNRFHILKTRHSGKPLMAFFSYLFFIVSFSGLILLFQKSNKLRKINFMLWPIKDAFSNNCEATPALILQRLSEKKKHHSPHYFQLPYRKLRVAVYHSRNGLHKLEKA